MVVVRADQLVLANALSAHLGTQTQRAPPTLLPYGTETTQ